MLWLAVMLFRLVVYFVDKVSDMSKCRFNGTNTLRIGYRTSWNDASANHLPCRMIDGWSKRHVDLSDIHALNMSTTFIFEWSTYLVNLFLTKRCLKRCLAGFLHNTSCPLTLILHANQSTINRPLDTFGPVIQIKIKTNYFNYLPVGGQVTVGDLSVKSHPVHLDGSSKVTSTILFI